MVKAEDKAPMTYGYLWSLRDEIEALKKEVAGLQSENNRLNGVVPPMIEDLDWVKEWKKKWAAKSKERE
jgi:hypothetical protein